MTNHVSWQELKELIDNKGLRRFYYIWSRPYKGTSPRALTIFEVLPDHAWNGSALYNVQWRNTLTGGGDCDSWTKITDRTSFRLDKLEGDERLFTNYWHAYVFWLHGVKDEETQTSS